MMPGKIFIFISAVAAISTAYVAYNILCYTPPIPDVILNEWWGPPGKEKHQDTTMRSFEVEFSDVVVNDLKERLMHRRALTPPLDGAGFTYGFNSIALERILDFWKNSYDFKAREAYLNKFPQFKTNVQGLDMHYIHVKPVIGKNVTVLPLLLLHGWPGSVREFYEMIPMLTTPRNDIVFEIIAPSLPGFGYSQGATRPGLANAQVAVIIHNLMQRIGHKSYYIHGGDFGASIATDMTVLFPDQILGFHSNFLLNWSMPATLAWFLGSLAPSLWLQPEEVERMYPCSERLTKWFAEMGYMHIQATKPDTVGVALTNDPAGLAAYILEKFSSWHDPSWQQAMDGNLMKKFFITDLLDNIMIYWTSSSITTSMRMYAENFAPKYTALEMILIPSYVPCWGIKFKYELLYQPDSLLRLKYRNLLQSTMVDDGGHFAAMENPHIMADDIFKAAAAFIQFNSNRNYHMSS